MAVTVIDCSLPVSRSFAWTDTMPSALISNVTSTSTWPAGARRRPVRMNSPKSSFSSARRDSPCRTKIFTAVWFSRTVVNGLLRDVGTVVFWGMSSSKYPPTTMMPSV